MIVEKSLTVESIAAGGDGVCRDGGLVVFVPRTAPGDVARITYKSKGAFARGRVVAIEAPSNERAEPPCDHYLADRCGGCQLQHLGYEAQLAAKRRIVIDAFQRIGKREAPDLVMHGSPNPWRYRRKLTLEIRRDGVRTIAGLHRYDAPAAIFQLRDCLITDADVVAVWHRILEHAELLPAVRQLRGSVLLLDGAFHFSLEGGAEWGSASQFIAATPFLASIWWTPQDGERELIGAGDGKVHPVASFAQVNASVEALVREHVLAVASVHAIGSVVEGYAGSAHYSRALAARGGSAVAIESNADALSAIPDEELSRVLPVRGLVERELPRHLPADLVIVNPPRAGMDAAVTSVLEERSQEVGAIVYISCDAATLARDLSRLPAFSVASVHCFDMFPQTSHVETVCELIPRGRK